jgi:hypothetical protein
MVYLGLGYLLGIFLEMKEENPLLRGQQLTTFVANDKM